MIILAISAVIAFIGLFLAGIPTLICIAFDISYGIVYAIRDNKYNKQASMLYSQLRSDMEKSILQTIGISSWKYNDNSPEMVIQLKSAQAVGKYDDIKFFKDNEGSFENVLAIMNDKKVYGNLLSKFLHNNEFTALTPYNEFEKISEIVLIIRKNIEFMYTIHHQQAKVIQKIPYVLRINVLKTWRMTNLSL